MARDIPNMKAALSLSPPKVTASWKNPLLRARADAALLKGMRQGARDASRILEDALTASLDNSTWGWDRMTLRANGEAVTSPRNIVDTGKLRASQSVKYAQYPGSTVFTVKYTAPYSMFVHYGGAIQPYGNKNANTVLVPARPWVDAVLNGGHGIEKVDLRTPYGTAIKSAWQTVGYTN